MAPLPATPPGPHGPLRVNGSALEAAGQFTLLPGLYKNTSFEVWGEAVKGKTWWRTEPGAGPARMSLPESLPGDRAPRLPGDPPAGRVSPHISQLTAGSQLASSVYMCVFVFKVSAKGVFLHERDG